MTIAWSEARKQGIDILPSLKRPHPEPHGWIQWKGADVCMDIHCTCGHHGHFDGGGCYHIKCPACGQVYECDGHIQLHPLDVEPEGTQLAGDEDERVIEQWLAEKPSPSTP